MYTYNNNGNNKNKSLDRHSNFKLRVAKREMSMNMNLAIVWFTELGQSGMRQGLSRSTEANTARDLAWLAGAMSGVDPCEY